MRFSIDVGSELELKLYQAVLLYKNDHGNRYMATVHGVVQQNGDGSPLLGAGQLLSTASLRELARQLGTGCPVEFLPDQVVARTPDLMAWWTPATVRAVKAAVASNDAATLKKYGRFLEPILEVAGVNQSPAVH